MSKGFILNPASKITLAPYLGKKWEYKGVACQPGFEPEAANLEGQSGWELCSVSIQNISENPVVDPKIASCMIFKRPIQENKNGQPHDAAK